MPYDPQMLKGVLTPLLLILLDGREDYGWSVVSRLQQAGFTELNEGTVYPALTRLEKTGLLTSTLRPSTSGPARKYYLTTPKGREEHQRLVLAWRDLVHVVDTVIKENR